jgi:hypothetical protein
MDYVYLALEWDPVNDVLDIKCAYTKRYNLENWLKKYFQEKTTFVGLKCYRIRGASSTEINPYELIRVDPGEL